MIKIEVLKEDANYCKVNVLGHAMYDDYGKDIVCSAVSSIVTTSINGILLIDKNSIDYQVNAEGINIIVKSNDKITQTLIRNMLNLLKELAHDYPKNIQIK